MSLTAGWVSEMEMDDYDFICPGQMNPLELSSPDHQLDGCMSVSSMNFKGSSNSNNQADASETVQTRAAALTRTPLRNQDHVVAERKRRERLNQHFIALSAIVPGLKRMDKASILGDAIKHLKQLQERVKFLEEENSKKSKELVDLGKKSQLSSSSSSSCDESFEVDHRNTLHEIEARISIKTVLIRIHGKKRKGFAVKLLAEIEKLHLSVVDSSFLSFGQFSVDVTIVAQMEDEFTMTVKELVGNLREAILKF